MPAGDFVLLLTGSANRDEREYDDPERFDVRRVIERPLGFGHGPHVCLGAALARMETQVAIEELLRLFPDFEVDESRVVRMHSSNVRGSVERADLLHAHDEPSRPLRSQRSPRCTRCCGVRPSRSGDEVFMMAGDRRCIVR